MRRLNGQGSPKHSPIYAPATPTDLNAVNAFPNLSFDRPVFLTAPDDDSNRVFVVEQDGVIRVFDNDPSVATSKVFLDISDAVDSGGEQGLLGLAFDSDYQNNGYFYVNYTMSSPQRTRIARFAVSATVLAPGLM